MKAIVCTQYGPPDVLQCTEAAKPIPKDDEVLIKIHAASVNPVDRIFRAPYVLRILTGLGKPRDARVGRDMAGKIEDVGRNITRFKSGDEVFGVCRGAFAEYACASEGKLVLKPANMSFEEAASVPVAALTALQALRDKGQIQPGQKVLVDGASGGVGTFAVQIAKALGAEVTAVCSITKMDTARAIGADHVIDYAQQDFTKSGQRYDLILAANAYHSIFAYRRGLSPRGIYVMAGGGGFQILQGMILGPLLSLLGRKKMRFFIANINQNDLGLLKGLLETGKVVPVIDRRYPLSRVAEALNYLEKKHAKGKIVLTVEHGNETAASGFSGT
jgi:NADPH:quinone reductase-like Zn-dependent oxidoreductase